MPVYLLDDKVLLNGGSVATSTDCCCGGGDCLSGVTALIQLHATGHGTDCPTFDISDSITVTLPSGGGFVDFTQAHHCISGCSPGDVYTGSASYLGTMFCSDGGSFSLSIQGVSACCGSIFNDCDPGVTFSCTCSSANGSPGIISSAGVFTYNFTGTSGGLTWNLDVTVSVTF